ncbi:ferric reductase-like transmembrane domain-containing protein [Parahaliea mediterranea]|uniref:ferric reductase-like transmembrane domain-containing protein n=1 Tax=Parahaliea mediterranea TaxID=651086 RepID=UPI000E2FC6CE|nr:ferric reductase-like transmembrane domain-containing protein [Parahaliea mediterranea]
MKRRGAVRWGLLVLCYGLALIPVGLALAAERLAAAEPVQGLAMLLGYLALGFLALPFVLRPLAQRAGALLTRELHRQLGYLALALVAAHMVLSLVAEEQVLSYLHPRAPGPMLAALLATVALLLLALLSGQRLRRAFPGGLPSWRWLHGVLALLGLLAGLYHAVWAALLLPALPRALLLAAGGLLTLAYCLSVELRLPSPLLAPDARFGRTELVGLYVFVFTCSLVLWWSLPGQAVE